MTPLETVKIAIKALDDKKAHDIQVVRVDTVTSIADYFVICTGTSNTHIKTLKEVVEHDVELAGERKSLFYDVQIRVHKDFRLEMHIDTDDANAAGVGNGFKAKLIKRK